MERKEPAYFCYFQEGRLLPNSKGGGDSRSMETEPTGVPELDFITGGLPPNGLTIVIGAPGTGKTVMALQMAMHHARQEKDVILFSAFSEPHEKLVSHLSSLSFFDRELVGKRITMLSLKTALSESVEKTLDIILQAARGKREPLIVIDGYRGMYQRMGATAAQDLLSGLSGRMPYLQARAIVTSESLPEQDEAFFELSSADALIGLHNPRGAAQPLRLLEVYKIRGHAYREGLHGLAISADGVVIYPRLAAFLPDSTPASTEYRHQFNLADFDLMLDGGLPELSTTFLVGDVGTGRTTFSLHYLLAGAQAGEPGLMVTIGDTMPDLLKKSDDLGLGLRSFVAEGRIHILEVPAVEINPYRLAWQLRTIVEERAIKRFVIDSISALEAAPSVQSSQHDYLAALTLFLRRSGVTTLMTQDAPQADVGDLGLHAVRMPTANNRVLLRRVAYQGRFYRVCSVVNMQRSDHDTRIHQFVIAHGGVRILGPDETQSGILAGIERELPVELP
jgi:circadian clock protein KaiC